MVRRPPTRSSVLIAILLLLAFVVWTWLTFNSAAFLAFDQRTVAPQLDPDSNTAEIAAAFALLDLARLGVRRFGSDCALGIPTPAPPAGGRASPGDHLRLGRS